MVLFPSFCFATVIDIGDSATDRDGSFGAPESDIFMSNPANATGTIDTVQIWANTNITGCKVGTFYVISGDSLGCRDTVWIGSVTSGSVQSFAVSLEVVTGDYIGMWRTSGNIEGSSTGGAGMWYLGTDHLIPGDSATYIAQYVGAGSGSLYGIGATVPPVVGPTIGTLGPGWTYKQADGTIIKWIGTVNSY